MARKARSMTFKVSENTYSRLIELAETKEMTMTSVFEQLVKQEYESMYGVDSE